MLYGVTNLNGTPTICGVRGLTHKGGGVGECGIGDLRANINTLIHKQNKNYSDHNIIKNISLHIINIFIIVYNKM